MAYGLVRRTRPPFGFSSLPVLVACAAFALTMAFAENARAASDTWPYLYAQNFAQVWAYYLDNWLDWGWRHIQAKHGWNQDDELATRSALQAPAFAEDEGNGVMRYIGPEYSSRGAICRRHVVVDYTVEAVSGEPYGIRTSFGRYVREAP